MRLRDGLVGAGLLLLTATGAWAAVAGVNPETEYNITYQIAQDQSKVASSVNIIDTTEIGGKAFLVVFLPGYKTKAYLDLDSIRTIIPVMSGISQDLE
jgi:hypothetical protein